MIILMLIYLIKDCLRIIIRITWISYARKSKNFKIDKTKRETDPKVYLTFLTLFCRIRMEDEEVSKC